MVNPMKTDSKKHGPALAKEDASQGARRATGEASSFAPPPDPEVVAVAKRRQFSSTEKRRILNAADRCSAPGEIGALLRREGLYSSMLSTWRRQRENAERNALEPNKRGPKSDPARAEARALAHLTQDNDRLRRKLAQAQTIIEVQRKLCTLFGLPSANPSSEEF